MSTKRLSEKFKRDMLLLLFEVCATLIDEDFSELSFGKVSTSWKRFLLNFTDMLASQSRSLLPEQAALKSLLNCNPRLYRIGSMFRIKSDTHVPSIRISGLWLEKYDFCIGEQFRIYPGKGQLILKRPDLGCPESLKSGDQSDG